MKISLRRYWALLSQYLKDQKAHFVLLALLVFSSIGLQIANPHVTRLFIDSVTTGTRMDVLVGLGLIYLGVAFAQQIVSVSATYMGESVAWRATNKLREDLATHSLSLDMGYHAEKSPGEFIERIETDATEFATFFSQLVIRVIGNVLLLVGILVSLLFVDVRLGAAFCSFAVTTLLLLHRMRSIAVPYQKAHREADTAIFGHLEEWLAGTEDIRSNGAVDYVLRKLYELHTVLLQRRWQAHIRQLAIGATAGLMMMVGYGIAFVLGYHLYMSGVITVGVTFLVINYTGMIARPIRELTQQVESLQTIGATVERIDELLSEQSRSMDGPGVDYSSGALGLEFADVSFAYAKDKPVLRNMSFSLQPGKVLGLLGRTGSGKTTIGRLIFRLYDPDHGVIRLDATDLRTARLAQLRERVAYVTQDVQLFQATVRDNITLFDTNIKDDDILEVIQVLGLDNWFSGLAEGLDTRLQSGGRSLSAGEAQLLALTRVFLRNPGLVVLDEASSRLDPATEHLVEKAIDTLLAGRTAIIIAHRLATLQRADEILVIEDGEAIEYGCRETLLADRESRFYRLHQTGLEEMLA